MRRSLRSPRPLKLYVALLALIHGGLFVVAVQHDGFDQSATGWLVLVMTFGLAEYVALLFQEEHARFGVSAAEALLLPMIVGYSWSQSLVGVSVAIGLVMLLSPMPAIQRVFNVAQYGCAVAAAASIWALLGPEGSSLTPHGAAVAIGAVLVFAALTHTFSAGAVSLATGDRFFTLTRAVAPTTLLSISSSVVMGLLLTVAALQSSWIVYLFPLPLGLLYFGLRAVVRQIGERDRVEHLHAASRALASGPDLRRALTGFLVEVADISRAARALAIVEVKGERVVSEVCDGVPVRELGSLRGPTLESLWAEAELGSGGFAVSADQGGPAGELLAKLDAQAAMIVPARAENVFLGALVVLDHRGSGGFDDADVRLLEALGNELAMTLDSHRLFHVVAEERERFRRIFSSSTEGMALIDDDGVVQAWNPALERITGHSAESVVGGPLERTVIIRDRDEHLLVGKEIVALPAEREVQLVSKDGPTRWISVVAGRVRSSDAGGWVVLVRDVTAQHLAEEAKSDFLSTISHELRTPLTTIKGALHALASGRLSGDANSDMVEVLGRGAERLERLVMNLLLVSQMEADGRPAVFAQKVGIGRTLRERVERVLGRHVDVVVDLPDDDLVVIADRERLEQVIEHLLDNAQKFSEPTGPIRVSLRRDRGYAHLIVGDDGPGVPAADHERIFERFVRLGDPLRRETQGAGVGLYIAKHAVEAMDGAIWVSSEAGRGAEFHVMIPLARGRIVLPGRSEATAPTRALR